MPTCPTCGAEVQSGMGYCPSCGSSLRGYNVPVSQPSSGSTWQSPPPPPTYPPPTTYGGMPSGQYPQQRHSHRKYIIGIIAALLIGLVIGGAIGFFTPAAPDVTWLTGNVSLNSGIHGTPNYILFASTETGNLTSSIAPNASYSIYLPIGPNYTVSIKWYNVTGSGQYSAYLCTPNPGSFTSQDTNATVNFAC